MGHRQSAHPRRPAGWQDRHRLRAQCHGVEEGARAGQRPVPQGKGLMPDKRAEPNRARDGGRVLALETSLSGPHATKILADMGAEVIKVERPGTGDVIRTWDSAVKGLSSGTVWVIANKRSLAIDVKQKAALDILTRLAARSDVFLENFAPGVAERMGLGARELTEANPRLIYCSLSGYGQD